MSYKVTAPLVQVLPKGENETGTDGYFYENAVIPDGWNDERCKELVEEKQLEVVKASDDDTDKVPTRSSSKGDWVAYATDEARGEDRLETEDAEKATRDELAELFLGPKE